MDVFFLIVSFKQLEVCIRNGERSTRVPPHPHRSCQIGSRKLFDTSHSNFRPPAVDSPSARPRCCIHLFPAAHRIVFIEEHPTGNTEWASRPDAAAPVAAGPPATGRSCICRGHTPDLRRFDEWPAKANKATVLLVRMITCIPSVDNGCSFFSSCHVAQRTGHHSGNLKKRREELLLPLPHGWAMDLLPLTFVPTNACMRFFPHDRSHLKYFCSFTTAAWALIAAG